MGIAIGIVLALGVIAVIAWPFLRPRQSADASRFADKTNAAGPLRQARMELYQQIRQAQNDFDERLIDEQEFRAQLEELKLAAARLLKQETESGVPPASHTGAAAVPVSGELASAGAISELEKEIAAARASLQKDES